jgi:glycosyltransferase involved in cell wall biosynthesis
MILVNDKSNSIDGKYSTTRLVTKQTPRIMDYPEDKFKSALFLPVKAGRKGEGGIRTQGYFKKSFDKKPLISIVTIVYNGEKYLEKTIQSVINQNYDNIEYIVIDGDSTDGTVDIIKKYEDKIDYWISEKDKGISAAFNKGVTCSTGERLLMLNTGDFFIDNSFLKSNISQLLTVEDVVFFSVRVDNNRNLPSEDVLSSLEKILDKVQVPHQSAFVKLSSYKRCGLYNTNFKIRMDYEFFLRLISCNSKFKYLNVVAVQYLVGGISMQFKNRALFEIEALISNYIYGKTVRKSMKNSFKKIFYNIYLVVKGFI